jgi:transcription elongation factor Elf1
MDCPKCNEGYAPIVKETEELYYLECSSCGHKFEIPVDEFEDALFYGDPPPLSSNHKDEQS